LFGFLGMVIGIPLFATAYILIRRDAEKRICKKQKQEAREKE
jgi:predicted PurR-regulated permease PerM